MAIGWPAQTMTTGFEYREFKPLRSQAGGVSSWSGHQPFAYQLVYETRPSLLVELGAHYGESYFTFCQAVVESSLQCTCYAVDTWQGDEQAGLYEGEVFQDVDAYNRRNYAAFSHLLRMTFDEAAGRFDDGTIDILHIDGLHTYEAVRHDYESWLPKVKPGGLVLFHDTHARHDDFGVWKLWDEITPGHEQFAFSHSWGLGVLRKPGGDPLPAGSLTRLLTDQPAGERERVRHEFYLAGSRIEAANAVTGLEGKNQRLRQRMKRLRVALVATTIVALAGLILAAFSLLG